MIDNLYARGKTTFLVFSCLLIFLLSISPALAFDAEPEPRTEALRAAPRAAFPSLLAGARVVAAEAMPAEHLWLARPFAPLYQQLPAYTYPYGSTGGGRYRLHTGVDISNRLGTPVLAGHDGQVYFAGNDAVRAFGPQTDFYGKLVVLKVHRPESRPVFVLYGHLNEVFVDSGQRVTAGDVIGTVGMTGIAIGPHLHLEVRVDAPGLANTTNPEMWLQPLAGAGVLAGRVDGAAGSVVHLYRGDRLLRITTTYPDLQLINPDDGWRENFVFSDLPAGEYRVVVRDGKRNLSVGAEVQAGRTTFTEFELSSPPPGAT